jgi:hypothetical protein
MAVSASPPRYARNEGNEATVKREPIRYPLSAIRGR